MNRSENYKKKLKYIYVCVCIGWKSREGMGGKQFEKGISLPLL